QTGECLCKKISFRTTGPEINFAICHCDNCRRKTGTVFTANAWFQDTNFEFTSGSELLQQQYDALMDSWDIVNNWFCSNFGSLMLTKGYRMPGISIVPCGLFRGKQEWKPDYEQYRRSRTCLVECVESAKDESRYDGRPELHEFERVWGKSGKAP
ncbi:Mss4-like protein, partial [Clohesyomyces aquaticus]